MKQKTIIGAIALLSSMMSSNVAAEMEAVSGALLKNMCTSYVDRPASALDGMCLGYVVGVMSVLEYANYFCNPVKSTHSQVTLVVKKYLSEHPEKLHLDADGLVLEALIEAFPCHKSHME
jgi:hypothetical protein